MCKICNGEDLTGQSKVVLQICPNLKKVPQIKGVKWLEIIQCKNIKEIEPIEGLLILMVVGCPNIETLPYIPTLKGLKLQCKKLNSIPKYENLERLELHNESVYNIPQYPKLQTLYLNHVSTDELPEYPNLLELQIHNSKQLMSIAHYKHLYKCIIQSCPKLLSINNINKTINSCSRIQEFCIQNCRYLENIKITEIETNNNLNLSLDGEKLKKNILYLENLYINKKNI